MPYTIEDVGACNCSAICVGSPCSLPLSNLSISVVFVGIHTASGTAVYSAGRWTTPWMLLSGTSYYVKITIGCTGACTWYEALFSVGTMGPGSPSLSGYVAIPTGCGPGSIATGSFAIGTGSGEPFTCSPLNIEFGFPNCHGFITP
jgi:hypothetical protein